MRTYMAVVLVCLVARAGAVLAQQEPFVMKYAHPAPTDHPHHRVALKFKAEVEKALPGVRVDIFPDGQMGDPQQVLSDLRRGAVSVAPVPFELVARFVPNLRAFRAPFLVNDGKHLTRVLYQLGQEIDEAMEDARFISFGCVYDGASDLFSREPIKALAELKGGKVGITSPFVVGTIWEKLGAVPQSMTWEELPEALRKGQIVAAEGTAEAYKSHQLYSSAPAFARIRIVLSWHMLSFSERTWLRLPHRQRTALMQAGQATLAFAQAEFTAYENRLAGELQANHGAHIYTPEDLPQWRAAVMDLYKEPPRELGSQVTLDKIRAIP